MGEEGICVDAQSGEAGHGLKEERVAIMVAEGASEEEAEAYCAAHPWMFGGKWS